MKEVMAENFLEMMKTSAGIQEAQQTPEEWRRVGAGSKWAGEPLGLWAPQGSCSASSHAWGFFLLPEPLPTSERGIPVTGGICRSTIRIPALSPKQGIPEGGRNKLFPQLRKPHSRHQPTPAVTWLYRTPHAQRNITDPRGSRDWRTMAFVGPPR